jgi:hypothetical protein
MHMHYGFGLLLIAVSAVIKQGDCR